MKIIIAGFGFVGKAVGNCLKEEHQVVVVDPKYSENKISDHIDADGIIICVNTPSTPIGGCDANQVCNVLDQVPEYMPVLIKSTISPEVVTAIQTIYPNHSICYSPEFLRAASSEQDFADQRYMIIGGEDPDGLWQEIFRSVLKKCSLYFFCTLTEASMVKYSINSFLSTKVAFFNQIFDLCQKNGADFDVVRQLIAHDTRIGPGHTLVPGPDAERGFGGACFPKDTRAFIKYAKGEETPLTILESVVNYNDKIRQNKT